MSLAVSHCLKPLCSADVFEEFLSPSMAAQTLLSTAASKRKQVLNNTVEFCMSVLARQDPPATPRQIDGVLHILGALSTILLKKDLYKNQVEMLLSAHIFPQFRSEHGFLRARVSIQLLQSCPIRHRRHRQLSCSETITGISSHWGRASLVGLLRFVEILFDFL